MELQRPSSVDELDGARPLAGGTELVPLLRDRLVEAERLADVRDIVPRGIHMGTPAPAHGYPWATIGAGTTLADLEADEQIPAALREACRLSASPQLRNMGSIGGNLLQETRCWYWRLKFPCRLHRVDGGWGDRCHARDGEHREHAIFANDFCASAHPSDPAAALLALNATIRTSRRELPLDELYRIPDEAHRTVTTLEPGELILELDVPQPDGSVYLKAMDRKRWSFAIVGVAAARFGEDVRIALAGVAPVPWLLSSLDEATPLPRNEYKLPLAKALVERARAQVAA